jgi:hypothetical protein
MAIVVYVNADADVSAGTGARLGFFALAFAILTALLSPLIHPSSTLERAHPDRPL